MVGRLAEGVADGEGRVWVVVVVKVVLAFPLPLPPAPPIVSTLRLASCCACACPLWGMNEDTPGARDGNAPPPDSARIFSNRARSSTSCCASSTANCASTSPWIVLMRRDSWAGVWSVRLHDGQGWWGRCS